uniref:Uncharacterized protein n=1 Tax=Acrobeloides nanus TaxID=290746 RepID=A0A914CKH1_9BILA
MPEGAPLMIEINDVTAAISDCIKRCLESEITKGNMTIDQSKPIIKDGCIAWIKFEFQSSHSIESACCVTDKYAEVISTRKWFFFKDEKDFRMALFEAEKKLKK